MDAPIDWPKIFIPWTNAEKSTRSMWHEWLSPHPHNQRSLIQAPRRLSSHTAYKSEQYFIVWMVIHLNIFLSVCFRFNTFHKLFQSPRTIQIMMILSFEIILINRYIRSESEWHKENNFKTKLFLMASNACRSYRQAWAGVGMQTIRNVRSLNECTYIFYLLYVYICIHMHMHTTIRQTYLNWKV